jgi:hypothetical protein
MGDNGKVRNKNCDKTYTDMKVRERGRWQYSGSYTEIGCPVTEVSPFLGTQKNRCLPAHLRMETGSVSKTLYSLKYRTIDTVQKLSNSEYYTPSSQPFRIYMNYGF